MSSHIVLVFFILVLAHSEAASRKNNPFRESSYFQELTKKINAFPDLSWKASFRPLKNFNNEDEDSMIVTQRNSSATKNRIKRYGFSPITNDWRSTGKISPPENQGACGSCWAFASVHTLMDNFRIRTTSTSTLFLSTQHVLECCVSRACGGCSGASDNAAGFDFLSRKYTVERVCKPYAFYGDPMTNPRYNSPGQICSGYCESDNHQSLYYFPKYNMANFVRLNSDINEIKAALVNGPLLAAVELYGDLYLYKSGIYRHIDGPSFGYHSVEMVGSGYEDGQEYWIIKNSWGPAWGENGYFRIAAGSNEAMIEEHVIQPIFNGEKRSRGFDEAFSSPVGGSRNYNTGNPDIQEVAKFIAGELKPVCRDGRLDSLDMEEIKSGETYEVERILHASTTVVEGIKYSILVEMSLPRCSELMYVQANVILSSANTMYSLQQYSYIPSENIVPVNNAGSAGHTSQLALISIIAVIILTTG